LDDDPTRLSDVLRSEGHRLGIESAVEIGTLFRRWSLIVGEKVAAHARPSSLREGVLRVRAESPVWATEISYFAPEIARRANDEVGRAVVKEVRVWWAPGEASPHPSETHRRDGGAAALSPGEGGARQPGRNVHSAEKRSDDPAGALERAHRAWRLRGRRAAKGRVDQGKRPPNGSIHP
jgi:hypothetical protein